MSTTRFNEMEIDAIGEIMNISWGICDDSIHSFGLKSKYYYSGSTGEKKGRI